ncbi:MAG: glycosyltransferase family 2 protein [Cellulosilyticaceae bacterium]
MVLRQQSMVGNYTGWKLPRMECQAMISIVIPNYNGEKYLKGCIASIGIQEGVDYEVILIDNASTDSDYQWLREDDSIHFYQLDKNYGFSRAVNEGIHRAKGEYVLLLNNDTILCEGFLEALLDTIQQDERIFAVCSKMINAHHRELIDDAGDTYTLLGWARKRGDGKSVELYTVQEDVFSACAGAALYRKSILDEIGGFDEAFFAYMEDVDISYRARIYGYRNVYCPEAKVYHIGSATSGSRHNPFKIHLAARNNIYVIYKNMPLLQKLINLPFIALGCSIKYTFFTLKGYGKPYREGFMEGMKTCKKLDKIEYKSKHFKHYLHIQYLLIKNSLPPNWH